MSDLHITGGRLVDPANGVDEVTDLFLSGGAVAGVGKKPKNFSAAQCIDAAGMLVLPGVIDLCARLQPGEAHASGAGATIAGETRAAAAGGITRLLCPPDTAPVADTPAVARMIQDRAAAGGGARVHPLGALTVGLRGERLADMALLMDAGCAGVGNAQTAVGNTLVMRRAMQYAATYNLPVFVRACDPWLQGNGVAHEGEISTRFGLPAIPEAAETAGVARDLALIETSGARAHFDLISTARAVEMIAEARERGLAVSAGVAVHQLHFNEGDIGAFDTRYKVFPPLRTENDRRALLRGLEENAIGAICSDHQPHDADAKLAPFVEAAPGISGLDTLLSMTLELAERGELRLATAVAALTSGPAAVIGMDAGHLARGAPADVCVFDPAREWTLDENAMQSSGKNSPWLGRKLRGRAAATIIGGEIAHLDGAPVTER